MIGDATSIDLASVARLPATLREVLVESIRPDPSLTVSQWADRSRVLDPTSSAEPGPWRTSRTPYAREPMDRLGPSDPCERVVALWGSQLGKTELGANWAGFTIEHSPCPMMIAQPTVDTGQIYSEQRIAPMIAASPSLRARVASPRSRDSKNTTDTKQFPGGILRIVGANSPAGLASMPIRRLHLDEVDRFPRSAGSEGDPCELAVKRTTTFSNRKILITSTPTLKGDSRIADEFALSDQRRYFVPCPQCGELQVLRWSNVQWPAGDPAAAFMVCDVNGCTIENRDKDRMLPAGVWRPTVERDDGSWEAVEDDPDALVRGYWLPSLYAPVGWISWGELAREFVAARGDPGKLQVFVNTRLAETWEESDGDSIDETGLLGRLEDFGADGRPVPAAVAVLTAGVDVQADRVELELVGWGLGHESWSLDYVSIYGDPSATAGPLWDDLAAYLRRTWPHESGSSLRIAAACVDSGYAATSVYAFVRPLWQSRVWAIKGKEGDRDIWPAHWSQNLSKGLRVKIVGVDKAKAELYSRLQLDTPGPGYCHFPRGRTADYFGQLTAEKRKAIYKRGRRIWVWHKPKHVRNEALDCRVYATAALHGWLSMGGRLGSVLDSLHRGRERTRAGRPATRQEPWIR